ncbi:hypothetical protein CDD83_10455 [Cordyceps sp. RAO-2017]|nr:hypothetical protein CDD83_10455 [Cordyceps sp. RAO-2017]
MAASGKPSKWGSFLSQAVAGVESRLDNILAEADDEAQAQQPQAARPAQVAAPAKPSPANSRSSSSARTNDRLQARLAKAMAGKNAPAPAESRDAASPRSSVDQTRSRPFMEQPSSVDKDGARPCETPPLDGGIAAAATPAESPDLPSPRTVEQHPTRESLSNDAADAAPPPPTQATVPPDAETRLNLSTEQERPMEPAILEPDDVRDLAEELEGERVRHQEEMREYVEKIDSLQSKVQYLSKNAADAAKQAAASAPSGSMDRKLAEKDEKIALLMEEGQKLSTAEHKFRTTIKKLRLQISEHEKQMAELRKDREKAASDAEALRGRLSSSEQQEETKQTIATLQKDISILKKEGSRKDDAYRRLEQEAKLKAEQAEAASAEALSKAVSAERDKQKELQDTISSLRTDKESLTDKARHENTEWQEKLQRAAERGRLVEEELRLELRSMEGKLEAMRAAAEEASSGSGGEAQVKMFRQIETLQSQYASAQENWQGIETSLLAKAASMEKERDEAQRREFEMRKKARDAASRCRQLEEELQDVRPALTALRQELEACREQLASLKAASKATNEALEQARADLEKERQRSVDKDDPVEADRRRWVDDVAGATSRGQQSRPDSPLLSVSRTFSSDLIALPTPGKLRRIPTPAGSIPDSPADLMSSMRRFSGQPPVRGGAASTVTSGPPLTPFSPFETPSEPPQAPSPTAERENGVDDTAPSSPRNIAQDMISASTVAAGPSVQLVERMSAAIRRLEAEKVAAKEEMARVCNQRDEARADMVGLMKDLEEAKAAAKRVPLLQEEVSDLDSRYQTTLEMLGEKSELVDELRADVQDVKAMYRELVERTVK